MRRIIKSTFILLVWFSHSVIAQETSNSLHSHAEFDQLLKKYVSTSGRVNYRDLKKDEKTLHHYIKLLEANPVNSSWTYHNQLAYWINLYNALTLQLILKNYPVSSIMDIEKAWDTPITTISGKKYTLNNIENDVIRPKYQEPRIHFAVNCAA